MASLFRLKGRALQIGNLSLLTLTFFTAIMLLFSVNLLPVLYIKTTEPYIYGYLGEYGDFVSLAFALLFYFSVFSVFTAISFGTKRFFLKKAQKRNPSSEDIFFYFRPKYFFMCIFYFLRISIIRIIILAFCLLPFVACLYFVYRFSLDGVSALVCMALFVTSVCLLINGVIFYSSFFSSFFLCDYYFIEGTYVSFPHLIASSQKMMSDKKKLLTRLKLSFSGWFILCPLIFPIPYVWSYYNQSLAVAAADFMKGNKE